MHTSVYIHIHKQPAATTTLKNIHTLSQASQRSTQTVDSTLLSCAGVLCVGAVSEEEVGFLPRGGQLPRAGGEKG